MKTAFVILHYLALEDTIECVESIINNINYQSYHIVIVDNNSYNNSYNELHKRYKKYSDIHLIKLEANLGFAKGNNAGYKYAKDNLNVDFIILINNDTIIKQQDFITKLISKYHESKFDILGPDIVSTKNGLHQNPVNNSLLSKEDLEKKIRTTKKKILLNRIGYYNIKSLTTKIIKSLGIKISRKNIPNIFNYAVEAENIQLHGSCLVFSPQYVNKYNGLYSETFMYGEEEILFYIASKEKLKIVYYPDVIIYHKEDISTDTFIKSNKSKRKFIYENSLKSLYILKNLQENNDLFKLDIYDVVNSSKSKEYMNV